MRFDLKDRRTQLMGGGILALLVVMVIFFFMKQSESQYEFIFSAVKIGDIEKTVTCTGTLDARGTVEVGSRISGTISKLYVGYNDTVKAGMTLGVLDTAILSAEYLDARSAFNRSQHRLKFSKREYNSANELYKKKLISNKEFLSFKTNFLVDFADYQSAKSKMQKSRSTIDYAVIKSPINGVVVDKNVEEGQTIAANFTTPVLYVIAEDLNEMEILVSVDESDIGVIKVGQKAKFTVNTYPDSTFFGKVSEIRMKPNVIQNVVNYIVVVDTDNDKNLLMPGMTATVDFVIEEKKNVLLVPITAIRFKPPAELEKSFHERMRRENPPPSRDEDNTNNNKENGEKGEWRMAPPRPPQQMGDRQSAGSPNGQTGMPPFGGGGEGPMPPMPMDGGVKPENVGQIWYLDDNGRLTMEPVMTGASDDSNIEILKHRNLKEGMEVIVGTKQKKSGKESGSSKQSTQIFGPSSQPPGGGGPPPGGGM